ncbi:MAG: sulfotransferase [Hyphomonadaceae bacterium]|nr:sulfotransferase [Hyphomonadaceae bacterium]
MSEDLADRVREAAAWRISGDYSRAAAAYEAILSRWPALPDCWYNLGWVQRRLGRPHEALRSYEQALAHGVAGPEEVRLNRAVIYVDDLHRYAEGEAELRAALAHAPDYAPALLNLANLCEDLGRRADALALYERLLAAHPTHWEGLSRYASLNAAATADTDLVARLRHGLERPDVSVADKASLGFALGKVLDAAGAYREAFAAYRAANAASRASAPPGVRGYDRAAQAAMTDALMATFPRPGAPLARSTRPAPIFICGMFRSGSTLLEQVLAGHSRVTAGGEIAALPQLVSTALAPFPQAMAQVDDRRLAGVREAYLDMTTRIFPGADILTDKRPDNFLSIGLIKAMFPDARIINTVRNPRDNCLSIYFLHLDHAMAYATDLADIAHYYSEYRRLMAHWRLHHGADIFDFDYDAFVRDPRPAVERVLAFCGLDWEEACLDFHRRRGAVKTASVWQVRRPLYADASGRWRHYAADLGVLDAALAPFIDKD